MISTMTLAITIWLGNPMVANPDPWYAHEGWIPGYEIGLRPDGVVIWRKKEAKE